MCIRLSNSRYLREDLAELAAEALQETRLQTQTTPEKINAAPEGNQPASPHSETLKQQSLTSEELAAISVVFADEIEARKSPTKKRVAAQMRGDEVLAKVLNSEAKVKRVVDRVRYLVRSQQPARPTRVPEEDPSKRTATFVESVRKEHSSDASVHSSASGRQAWTQEENEMIKTAFAHFDKVPRNTEIRSVFSSHISLEQILQTNPFARIRHKVKNIFKNRK